MEPRSPKWSPGGTNGAQEAQLELLPIVETTWGMWRKMHPDTQVAIPGTGLDFYSSVRKLSFSNRELYDFYPYRDYRTNNGIGFPLTTAEPDLERFHPKATVLGVCRNSAAKSYPFDDMPDRAVINDDIGGDRIVVVFDKDSGTAIPYFSRVDGRDLTFYVTEEAEGEDLPVMFQDVETGTRWDMLGRALEGGEFEKYRLEQVPAHNSMWFAWDTYWRGAPVWEGEGIIDIPQTAIAEDIGASLPTNVALSQNFPNPFNPTTHIQVTLPLGGRVSLLIYDTLGQHIRTLIEGERGAGFHLLNWDGRDSRGDQVASGSYLYRLETAAFSETRTMTLLH